MICVRLPCHLRQVMCYVASNHAPICIKKRAVLRQVAIVLSYSCVAISPFQSSFPIFSAFYFPVSCFSIPVFFRCFLTKYVLKFSLSYYQMSLISSIIFLDIFGCRLRQGEPKPQGEVLLMKTSPGPSQGGEHELGASS